MSELIRRDDYDPAPVSRQTRKELERIEQAAMVRRAALEAAAKDAVNHLEAREQLRQYEAQSRIKGTYDLAEYADHRATQLNHGIGQQTRDNPGLELILRNFENTAAVTTNLVIYQYGTGR